MCTNQGHFFGQHVRFLKPTTANNSIVYPCIVCIRISYTLVVVKKRLAECSAIPIFDTRNS